MMTRTSPGRVAALAAVLVLGVSTLVAADFDQAMSNFKSGKYVEAAADFQALVDQSPEYDSGYFMLAQCFVQMGKLDDAQKNFRKAIELNPDRFEYHYGLATTYFKLRQYSNVVGTLRTAEGLAGEGHAYSLHKLRGLAYASLEKWPDAIEDLEKAKAVTKTAPILEQLGLAYYSLGHNDKAVPVLREAHALAPGHGAIMVWLANALMDLGASSTDDRRKQGYYTEALQVAEKYLKLNPADHEANNLVGRSALGAKQYTRAEQAFLRVLEQKPDHCYAMVNLGKVYTVQSRWADAESILKRGAACAPRMAVIYESLGFVVQKQKRLAEALEFYQKAYDIKPSSALEGMMANCRQNIQIAEENAEMARLEKEQQEAERKAQEEYEKEKAKAEAWKKKTERDQ